MLINIALPNSMSDSTESVDKNTLSLNYYNRNENALKSADFLTESEFNILTMSDRRNDAVADLGFAKAIASCSGDLQAFHLPAKGS